MADDVFVGAEIEDRKSSPAPANRSQVIEAYCVPILPVEASEPLGEVL